MIRPLATDSPRLLAFALSDKLRDADYQILVPLLDAAVAAHGKVRLLVAFEDFHGWDVEAAWDDFKVGLKHYADIERIAIVGERRWEQWAAKLLQAFTRAQVRYFDAPDKAAAWDWIREA